MFRKISIIIVIIIFLSLRSYAQVVYLKIDVKSSLFKQQADSLSLVLENQVLERYKSDMLSKKQTIYPIKTGNVGKYYYQIIVSDTLYDYEVKHKLTMFFCEQDVKGKLAYNEILHNDYETALEETLRWASVDLAVFGNVSHTINTKSKNIENQHKESLAIRNIIILFEMGKGVKKADFNLMKAIIYNKYNGCQQTIRTYLEQNGVKKYCNVYFYDEKIPKHNIENPVVVTYHITRKGNNYEMKQKTVGQYTPLMSEPSKEMIIEVEEFRTYPIMHLRMLSGSAYPLMQEILELD
jgi:hypothetical protein